jgi:hypothetical protein
MDTAYGFQTVDAVSLGANDSASLTDTSTGLNTFNAYKSYATLSGTGYYVEAANFRYVTAWSSSAKDVANMYGPSNGVNTFDANPGLASMSGSGYDNAASNFPVVNATCYSPSDVANLAGASATLVGPGYQIQVTNIATVNATSNSSSDTASLKGATSGVNTFSGGFSNGQTWADLQGSGYAVNTTGFGAIYATSRSSSDAAYFFASPGATFSGTNELYGSLNGRSWSEVVSGFPQVFDW